MKKKSLKKRFIQFMLMLMVAAVPYTATPFVSPASADSNICPNGVGPCVSDVVSQTDPSCNGGGNCCAHHPTDPACAPPPDCRPYCVPI